MSAPRTLGADSFRMFDVAGYDYNALYKSTPDALGDAYQPLAHAFETYLDSPKTIVDIGCGQGRDALPLARQGHHVTAVDIASDGIQAITDAAKAEGLEIATLVTDLAKWRPTRPVDVLLCNRTLHMLPTPSRHALFTGLLDIVAPKGFVFLVDEPSNMAALIDNIAQTGRSQSILRQTSGDYFVQLDT